MATFILIAIFVILLLNIFKAAAQRQTPGKNFRDYTAAMLNLERSGDTELSGTVDGLRILAWTEYFDNGQSLTFCQVEYAEKLSSVFQLVKGSLPQDGTGTELHINGLTEEPVHGTAEDTGALQDFLSGPGKTTLKNCFRIYPEVKVTEQYLILGCPGITDGREFVNFIERTVSAARVLSTGKIPPKKTPKRTDGKVPLPILADDAPLQMPQAISLPAKPKAAPIPVEQEEQPLPIVPKITVETVMEEKPVSVMESEPAVELPPESINAESFAGQLFGAAFPGEKEKAIFEQKKGQSVQWTGKLLSVYSFSTDFVFGKGPGAKASFQLCEIAGAYGMKNRIKVTVQFSPETEPLLHGKSGETFSFSGTLLKFEPFAKEIFLTNGTLL